MNIDLNQISDAELHAYLDNQLDENEKSHILNVINANPELQQRLSELRQLRDMYQHAYDQVPRRRIKVLPHDRLRPNSKMFAIAASILVIVGALLGWISHMELIQYETAQTEDVAMLQPQEQQLSDIKALFCILPVVNQTDWRPHWMTQKIC